MAAAAGLVGCVQNRRNEVRQIVGWPCEPHNHRPVLMPRLGGSRLARPCLGSRPLSARHHVTAHKITILLCPAQVSSAERRPVEAWIPAFRFSPNNHHIHHPLTVTPDSRRITFTPTPHN